MSSLTIITAGGHGASQSTEVIRDWNFGPKGNRHWLGLLGESLPQYYNGPAGVTGSPMDDQLTFEFERPVFFNIHNWYAEVFSFEIKQRRLMDGSLMVEAARQGAFVRCCWTYADRYTPDDELEGSRIKTESATGLITLSSYVQNHDTEAVTMTLFRGDKLYCKVHNEIESAVGDCP